MRVLLLILFSILITNVSGQESGCSNYACAIEEARKAVSQRNYEDAFNKIESADAYPNSSPVEISKLRESLFRAINQERKNADVKAREARIAAERARDAEKRANQKAQEAQEAKKEVEEVLAKVKQEQEKAEKAKQEAEAALAQVQAEQKKNERIISQFFFYAGRFALAHDGEKYGYIDKKGNTQIDFNYSEAIPFNNTGFAKVKKKGNAFLIDTLGEEYLLATDLRQLDEQTLALEMQNKELGSIPNKVFKHSRLKILLLDNNKINDLSTKIDRLDKLRHLDISNNRLTQVPMHLGELDSLRHLDVSNNRLTQVPMHLGELDSLRHLDLSGNSLLDLPEQIGVLKNLEVLKLTHNTELQFYNIINAIHPITKELSISTNDNVFRGGELLVQIDPMWILPDAIGQLDQLVSLDLKGGGIDHLPDQIGSLTSLIRLNLSDNELVRLPREIGSLEILTDLDVSRNNLSDLPDQIGSLTSLIRLNLSDNELVRLPREIGSLEILTDLDVSRNNLSDLPDQIGSLTSLIRLNLSDNELVRLPREIGSLEILTDLDVSGNNLSDLPDQIGSLTSLTDLDLSGNSLSDLPSEIIQLKSLSRVDIRENPIPYSLVEQLETALPKCEILFPNADYYFGEKQYFGAYMAQKQAMNKDTFRHVHEYQLYNLGRYALFAGKPEAAIQAALKCMNSDSFHYYVSDIDSQHIISILALGYLFNDQWDEAKKIYDEFKNETFRVWDMTYSFADVFSKDIQDLEAASIIHSDFEKVRAILEE